MRAIYYLPVLAIAFAFASCSKEGPAGPEGPQGPSGVANITSHTYTVTYGTSSDWTDPNDQYDWVASFSDPDITDNNADAVIAYWSTSASGWLALPVSSFINNSDEMSYGYDDGIITFSYYTGGTDVHPPSYYSNFSTIYFKVMVIPPAIQVKYPNTNWKNASEVTKIPEVSAALMK